ncbi:MAG: hypothetical protein KAG14_03680 [Mycoplasmataceae bacterium]|nr:hypothetical protein [Mycoplasmataceae bacterium]
MKCKNVEQAKEKLLIEVEKRKRDKRNFKNITTYTLWAKSGGKCYRCKSQLVEFSSNDLENTTENSKNISQRAHIISHNSSDFRPPYTHLYSGEKEIYEHYEEKTFGEKCIIPSDKLLKEKNILLLCRSCHLNFDKKIIRQDGHAKSVIEMINIWKIMEDSKDNPKLRMPPSGYFNISERKNIQDTLEVLQEIINKETDLIVNFDALNAIKNTDVKQKHIDNLNTKLKTWNTSGVLPIKEITDIFKSVESSSEQKKLIFTFNYHSENDKVYIDVSFKNKETDIVVDTSKSKKELRKTLKKEQSSEYNNWIINSTSPKGLDLEERREFKLLHSLLTKSLLEFSMNDSEDAEFNSYSIAYMARWGTGKTTMINAVKNKLKNEFRFVEINLWHIANSIPEDSSSVDNLFVRSIVKEALTQMSSDPEVVANYLDSSREFAATTSDVNLTDKELYKGLGMPDDSKDIKAFTERNKFIDQFMHTLKTFINTLFKKSLKPVVFVFDDLDRVSQPDKVHKILDALVTFLNMKNCVFVIPVDESKVIGALLKRDSNIDPNEYMNKYFNYSIKVPFIPKLETIATVNNILEKEKMLADSKELRGMISKVVAPNYRSVKDFVNLYNLNKFTFEDHKFNFGKKSDKILVAATAFQQKFPLLIDYLASGIEHHQIIEHSVSDIRIIKEYLLSTNESNDIDKEFPLSKRDSEFWYSLSGIYNSDKRVSKISTFFSMTDRDLEVVERNKKIWKRISKNFINIYDSCDMKNYESEDWISFWGAITQASISNPKAIEFAKNIPLQSIALEMDEEKRNVKISEFNDNENKDEIIIEYISNIDSYVRNGFIKNQTPIMIGLVRIISELDTKNIFNIEKNRWIQPLILTFIEYSKSLTEWDEQTAEMLLNMEKIIILSEQQKLKKQPKPDSFINERLAFDMYISTFNEKYKEFINENIEQVKKDGSFEDRFKTFVKDISIKQVSVIKEYGVFNEVASLIELNNYNKYKEIQKLDTNIEHVVKIINKNIDKLDKKDFSLKTMSSKYIDAYGTLMTNGDNKFYELKNDVILKSDFIINKIISNIDKISTDKNIIKNNFEIYSSSEKVRNSLSVETVKKIIDLDTRKEFYKVINKDERLIKMVILIADKQKVKNFIKILSNGFQEIMIQNHELEFKENQLVKGIRVSKRSLSKIELLTAESPWIFEIPFFEKTGTKDELKEFLVKRTNAYSTKIGAAMYKYLYKNGDWRFSTVDENFNNDIMKQSIKDIQEVYTFSKKSLIKYQTSILESHKTYMNEMGISKFPKNIATCQDAKDYYQKFITKYKDAENKIKVWGINMDLPISANNIDLNLEKASKEINDMKKTSQKAYNKSIERSDDYRLISEIDYDQEPYESPSSLSGYHTNINKYKMETNELEYLINDCDIQITLNFNKEKKLSDLLFIQYPKPSLSKNIKDSLVNLNIKLDHAREEMKFIKENGLEYDESQHKHQYKKSLKIQKAKEETKKKMQQNQTKNSKKE